MKLSILLTCMILLLVTVSGCKQKEAKLPQSTIKTNAAEIMNEAQKIKDSSQQQKQIDENEK